MGLYIDLAKRFVKAQAPEGMRKNLLPMKLTMATTFLCNHRCKMCDIWLVYRKDREKLKKELTRDDFGRIFTEMKDALLYIDWGGGEPFLRADMVDLIKDAARICTRLSSFVITTNGLMTERILSYMTDLAGPLKHLFAIGVSLDGDKASHDNIRGKEGAYDNAIETIRGLKALSRTHPNIEVKISYTISYRNAGKFESFHEQVLKPLGLKVGDVGFGLEHVGGLFQTAFDPHKSAVGRVSEGEFRAGAKRDIEYIISHLESEHLPALQRMKSVYRMFFLREIPAFLDQPQKMVIPCKAGRSSLYVDPYGYLYPCIVWNRCLGHYSEGIGRILASDLTRKTRHEIDEGKCPVCWNACEAIPSLLSSMRMVSCVARSFTDARVIRSLIGTRDAA